MLSNNYLSLNMNTNYTLILSRLSYHLSITHHFLLILYLRTTKSINSIGLTITYRLYHY